MLAAVLVASVTGGVLVWKHSIQPAPTDNEAAGAFLDEQRQSDGAAAGFVKSYREISSKIAPKYPPFGKWARPPHLPYFSARTHSVVRLMNPTWPLKSIRSAPDKEISTSLYFPSFSR